MGRESSDDYIPLNASDSELEAIQPLYDASVLRSSRSVNAWTLCISVASLFLSIASAIIVHTSVSMLHVPGAITSNLRRPNPYPQREFLHDVNFAPEAPDAVFPSVIIRIDSDAPDQVFYKGTHVLLSETSSMIYEWHMQNQTIDMCLIDAFVPDADALASGNKSYTALGNLSTIQVWNVTTPDGPLHSLSWNSRPRRLNMIGTVEFASNKTTPYFVLRPPAPFFKCPRGRLTVEIACSDCELEFEQTFSLPALGFDIQEIS